MTAFSDRIAAEHTWDPRASFVGQIAPDVCMACGATMRTPRDLANHIADVTERAVRDAIVAELADAQSSVFYPTCGNPNSLTGKLYMQGVGAGIECATLLAREGTTP